MAVRMCLLRCSSALAIIQQRFTPLSLSRAFSVSHSLHSSQSANVGFIGLGNMGGPMAKNLITKGEQIIVYDVYGEAMKPLQDAGAQVAKHPAQIAQEVDRIITMLPNSQHVQEVYTGEQGILQTVRKGALLIDSSTIDPSVSKDIANLAEKKGATMMDAPVSGGVNAAKAGTLTFMVGGSKEKFETARILLSLMAKNVVYCGGAGMGQAAKICNNMLLAVSMIGTAETMNLGIRLGLDPKLMANVINSSSGRCWSSEVYNPVPGVLDGVPSANNYQGGFGTALMTKDLGLSQGASTHTMSPTPMGSLAHQLYRMMTAKGYGSKDFSSVYMFLQEMENQKN